MPVETFIFNDNPLRYTTPADWTEAVINDFDHFLQDHAAAEKKASGMALSMISHYPDRTELVEILSALAIEELQHFKEVIKWLHKRGVQLAADRKDLYILAFREHIRKGRDLFFLDRLITAAIIEARGCERFGLVANALPAGELKDFYMAISHSEQRHFTQFIDMAKSYFDVKIVDSRVDELLDIEALITSKLPIQAALH